MVTALAQRGGESLDARQAVVPEDVLDGGALDRVIGDGRRFRLTRARFSFASATRVPIVVLLHARNAMAITAGRKSVRK
jgi:hypothetical protein